VVERNTSLPPTEAIKNNYNGGCSAVKKKRIMTSMNLKITLEKALEEIAHFLQSDGGDISLFSNRQ